MRTMTRSHTKNTKRQPAKYAYIPFRPTPLMDIRIRKLSARTGQSVGAIIRDCISASIGTLEANVR